MIAGLFDLSVFGVCIAAGLYYRRRPDIHKRFMLLGTAGGLMWAAITRIPYVATQFGLCVAILFGLVLASALHDWWTEKKVHPVSLWGGLAIVALFLVRPVLGSTTAWHSIAEWLVAHGPQLY